MSPETNNMPIKSPITGSNRVAKEREIDSESIIAKYQHELGIDVRKFFASVPRVTIYCCLDTGYRFYYPFTVAGDDNFYQELEKFPWYYMDWKWEHRIISSHIQKKMRVLEIGCARGTFIQKINEMGAEGTGLELNSAAATECRKNGLQVFEKTVEAFSASQEYAGTFDLVCSFQVVEHISNIRSFVEASLKLLKPGGRMVIGVPNNDSFMLKGIDGTLNMPPHHMGMWNMNSLIKLQDYFDMRVDEIHLEPLQTYHEGFAHRIAEARANAKVKEKLGIFSKAMHNLARRFARLGASALAPHIVGHSILITFKKNESK
jgi:SAM-dependent methyltransferase